MTRSYVEYRDVKYFTPLDGVRAVAVLMVVTWHVPGRQFLDLHGFRGVTAFFVLSGYLITTLGLREESKLGRLRVSGFFVRRVFRILPLYYLVLFVNAGVVYLLDTHAARGAFGQRLPYYLVFLQEYPQAARFATAPFEVSWSLGIEEKFYVIWPLVAFLLLRGRRNERAAVLAATTVSIVLLGYAYPNSVLAGMVTPYVFVLLGCLLAVVLHDPSLYTRLRALGRPDVAVLVAATTALVWVFGVNNQAVDYAFGLLVTLTIAGLVIGDTVVSRALSVRVVVWVGTISYPIYLVHTMGLTFSNKVLGVPGGPDSLATSAVVLLAGLCVTLIGSELLHRLVEVPMINVGRRLSARVGAPRATTSEDGEAHGSIAP